MALSTELTERLGLEAPVILAPMAGVAGGALAAAVSRAGGLGFIGAGYCDKDWIESQWPLAEGAPVGIGFITWALRDRPDVLDRALERGPKAVFLSFGDIGAFADEIKAAGAALFAQVQTVDQARRAVDDGAEFIVAQGTEAGGHGAARATLALVPAVKDAVGAVPVIAAGGIADGRGLAAALMLGAEGAVCGTAFFASNEALSPNRAKQVAIGASGDQTERSNVFDLARGINWPAPWTLRALTNRFSEKWAKGMPEAERGAEQNRYAKAAAQGDFDTAAVIVGEAVDLVIESRPAGDILRAIVGEAEELLSAAPRYVRAERKIKDAS